MRMLKLVTCFSLVATACPLLAQQADVSCQNEKGVNYYFSLSYDELLALLDKIESGEFQKMGGS